MKKRLIAGMMLCALAAASCDDEKCDSVRVYINGKDAQNKSITDSTGRLSVKEVCKLGELFLMGGWTEENKIIDEFGNEGVEGCMGYLFKINPELPGHGWIDTANCRLRFTPDIINFFETDREEHGFFREDFKFVLTVGMGGDTVAYIPTTQRMAVVDELLVLFDNKEKNWDRICQLFTDAFIFIPCAPEEWKELKKRGEV